MRIVLIVQEGLFQLLRHFGEQSTSQAVFIGTSVRFEHGRIVMYKMEIIEAMFRCDQLGQSVRLVAHLLQDKLTKAMLFVRHTIPRPVANTDNNQTRIRQEGERANRVDERRILMGHLRFVRDENEHGEILRTMNAVRDEFSHDRQECRGSAQRHISSLLQVP